MDAKKADAIRKTQKLDELLDVEYGIAGAQRTHFERESLLFAVSEMLKQARKEAHLTQEELAKKIGTQKSYISKIESGRSDINLATLSRIVEEGLGRKLQFDII